MVDLVDAGIGQPLGLFGREQAEAGTDIEVILLLDLRHDRADEIHLPLRGAAGRDHDAEGLRLPLRGELRRLQQLRPGKEVVFRDLRLGHLRLGAVAAVFRAEAALGIHQEKKLHGVAEELPANGIGGGQHVEQVVIG